MCPLDSRVSVRLVRLFEIYSYCKSRDSNVAFRHEALHDDVTEQDRAKPRKYEEEMEVTWEKGGPGLVWFTDKNYWDEREKGSIFLPVSLQVVNVLLASIIHYDYYVTKFLRGRHVMQPHLTSCIARN